MGAGKLRNRKCPCSSGRKYKDCHWPQEWKYIPIGSAILPDWQPIARPIEEMISPPLPVIAKDIEEAEVINPKEAT